MTAHVHVWVAPAGRHPDSSREVCACGATRWESYLFREAIDGAAR